MNATTRAYTKATQETASKERLMVLLFETALRHTRQGASLLEQKKGADATPLLVKARDIVSALASTFDAKRSPELARTLGELYVYVGWRLQHAATYQDAKAARDAEAAFAPVVEGFQQAVAALQSQATP